MENRIKTLDVKLINYYKDSLKAMWIAARNCYYKGDFEDLEKQYDKDKAINLLKNIYNNGHKSILEQAPFQFQISGLSRSCLAQFTRHRVGWSFAVQSQHFQKHNDFNYKNLEQYIDENHRQKYLKLMDDINNFYKDSLELGLPRYIAREVLPNSTSVHLIVNTNLRALDHFWNLRKGKENTPEIRSLAEKLYNETKGGFIELDKIIIW